jgi:predicted TIM-barrel fold metal-dependent hydrolase
MSGSFASMKRLADENDVAGVCVVQPSSFYGWDNRFICDLALAEPGITAAICTLNPDDRSSPALVARLKELYGIRGLRSLPASDGRIDHPGVRELWRACADNDITINVCIKRDRAHELAYLLEDFPGVRCVIDHCLLLAADPSVEETLAAMLRLAHYPNAFAKLCSLPSGNVEEYPYSRLHEPYRRIIAAYTPSRCVWGSNFPCELWTPRSTYRQNLDMFTSELGLDVQAQEAIFWNTPWRLWFGGK